MAGYSPGLIQNALRYGRSAPVTVAEEQNVLFQHRKREAKEKFYFLLLKRQLQPMTR